MFGHRWRFTASGATMRWDCARCGAPGGAKDYADSAEARRFAAAFDEEPRRGNRHFHLGTAPLWLWRRLRSGR